jgi:predicted transposase YbfD/YdcC
MNRGRHEQRVLTSRPYSSEQACFPCVEQIAKGFRKTSETKGERVYSITSRDPQNLDAAHWLSALRTYWGIESGLHQRLDASANEDLSRVRNVNAIWVLGMFRRLTVSLYAQWRSKSEKRMRASLHNYHDEMSLHNQKNAFCLVFAKAPSLKKGAS